MTHTAMKALPAAAAMATVKVELKTLSRMMASLLPCSCYRSATPPMSLWLIVNGSAF
jgi:hypothetical protein